MLLAGVEPSQGDGLSVACQVIYMIVFDLNLLSIKAHLIKAALRAVTCRGLCWLQQDE